jgi:hypothetical protein
MSEAILVLGASGGGKSTSVESLPPDSTFLFNILGKRPPFPGSVSMYSAKKKNLFIPDLTTLEACMAASSKVVEGMRAISKNRPNIKQIVIDDYQYLISSEYMERANEFGFDKFRDMGKNAYDVFQAAKTLRDDLKVIILAHTEEVSINGETHIQMKTFGKMFRQTVTPEGYFSIVLMADPAFDDLSHDGATEYRFRTQTTGRDPAKSPKGMFPYHIPNDLSMVVNRIDEYYSEGIPLEESAVFASAGEESTEGVTEETESFE